jgi:ubiquinone/menaquinone biosynthesis C-methylase UbiE
MRGKESRGVLGKDKRYNPQRLRDKPLITKYFVQEVRPYLRPDSEVLDYGCGPGTFLSLLAPFCRRAVGVDITEELVIRAREVSAELGLQNTEILQVEDARLPFADGSFDMVLFIDVIHHLEDIQSNLKESLRVLKPGGRMIVFEPNKLNPLIYAVHWMDPNEYGLLKLGTPWKYRSIVSPNLKIEKVAFNGIVIGPDSKIYELLSDLINSRFLKPVLGWLNPKMMIIGRKP